MSVAFWCVLIAAVLPYVFTGLAKAGAAGFDNQSPRAFLAGLQGWRQRAHWAQLNGFEAFPPFAAAVIIAEVATTSQPDSQIWINGLAVAFVALRALHGAAYLLDWATLRSLIWTAGFGCVIALFVVAANP